MRAIQWTTMGLSVSWSGDQTGPDEWSNYSRTGQSVKMEVNVNIRTISKYRGLCYVGLTLGRLMVVPPVGAIYLGLGCLRVNDVKQTIVDLSYICP